MKVFAKHPAMPPDMKWTIVGESHRSEEGFGVLPANSAEAML
jgi:hypothetical protein